MDNTPDTSTALAAHRGHQSEPISAGLAQKEPDAIEVHGARQHNLKNISVAIPKKKLVVLTGPSGSGKSSLAFDTIFAEGQRRYVESLSAYARQFLGQMDKPDYDSIRGLSPTISIDQKSSGSNPRSTVGTITEIYDYLRVLFARVGKQSCHSCHRPVGRMSAAEIVDAVLALPEGTKFLLLAPLVRNRKGEFRDVFADLMRDGFTRVKIDGEVKTLEEGLKLAKNFKHNIDVVIDRLVARSSARDRIADSVETTLRVASGVCMVEVVEGETLTWSEKLYCHHCSLAFPELSPQSFSFNSPLGMCESCNGLGESLAMDADKIVPDPSLSLRDGAVAPWGPLKDATDKSSSSWAWDIVKAVCDACEIDLETPWSALDDDQRTVLMHGTDGKITVRWKRKRSEGVWEAHFEGVVNTLMRRYKETASEAARNSYGQYLSTMPCPACEGTRLRPDSRAVFVDGRPIQDLTARSVGEMVAWFDALELNGNDAVIGTELVREIKNRLRFLTNVGLDYLSLSRPGPSLSGGEMQRIRLASQIGSELSGVLYILDEPSIGLHQRDNLRLLETLKHLRDTGNSVLVVEHDQETMMAADWIVDFGPGAGRLGGEVVFSGTPADIVKDEGSMTGGYLSGRLRIEVPEHRRGGVGEHLSIYGARANNLRNVDVHIPLGTFTCVTGVSGAGKSTLVNDILFPAASRAVFPNSVQSPGLHDRIEGLGRINKVIDIDQKPIGRTPRSNPATYTKLFDLIRDVYAGLPEARMYGYTKGRFSFNVKGGRCEACGGDGQKKIEMHFLADVYVPCEVCNGHRFNDATLKVKYRGYSIADVLEMTVEEAFALFEPHPKLRRMLKTLMDVGLDYIHLGQPSPTLSGGEAQRVKLSRELAKIATGDTLYILDEPSTGLHFDDIRKLLVVVNQLVDAGNTVVMIEHNLDIIKTADHVIDVGPEGGSNGGRIVAVGTPEEVVKVPGSWTGRFLAEVL